MKFMLRKKYAFVCVRTSNAWSRFTTVASQPSGLRRKRSLPFKWRWKSPSLFQRVLSSILFHSSCVINLLVPFSFSISSLSLPHSPLYSFGRLGRWEAWDGLITAPGVLLCRRTRSTRRGELDRGVRSSERLLWHLVEHIILERLHTGVYLYNNSPQHPPDRDGICTKGEYCEDTFRKVNI